MAYPNLSPVSAVSAIRLPANGTYSNVAPSLPLGVYSGSLEFISGAVDQVAFVYQRLGGNILDLEIQESQVYAAYEEAVLEYGYITNLIHGKSVLSSFLGSTTASFDHNGNIVSGPSGLNLKYPRFKLAYAKTVGGGFSDAAGVGGYQNFYSASIDLVDKQQNYDLQELISSNPEFSSIVGTKRVDIRKVFYRTPRSAWRFYGYYGGYNVVGNLSTYGMFADDSTFEVIPPWHNKLQAMAYEESINMRLSHMSYEIHNNQLRIFPIPRGGIRKLWVHFTVEDDAWAIGGDGTSDSLNGVNSANTLPFDNLPYSSINSMGKQWIRRYALAICKEMLGQVRSKIKSIPIPGNDITLNGEDLIGQGKEERQQLREELLKILDEMTYAKLAVQDAEIVENVSKIQEKIPMVIYVG
jgi:hypothetical protein